MKKRVNTILNNLVAWRIKHIKERQFLYILSFVIGIFSGFAALILKNLIHLVESKLTHWLPEETGSFLFIIYPFIGIILTVLFVRYLIRDNLAHGVSKILYAFSKMSGKLKAHNTYSSMVASSLTIGFGGSVGAEAPIVLTGASIGSNLARLFRLNFRYVSLMVGCGAAGAIAGIFKAPITGVVFTLEVLMLDLTMAYLIPLLIAAITSASLSYFFMGDAVLLKFSQIHSFDISNIIYYILLGLFCGLVSLYFTRISMYVEGKFGKVKNPVAKLLIGSFLLGLLIFIFPPLWGEGYSSINEIFRGNGTLLLNTSLFYTLKDNPYWFLVLLAGILIFKVMAMSATTGAGGVGGIFAPTLFMGATGGFFVARFLNTFYDLGLPEDNFALAGMAGMMAGVMHAPLTAIFLTAEITGGYGLFMPLILTSTVAYVTIMRFEPHSIYTKRLAQRGELLTHHKDKSVLRLMQLKDLIETDFEIINPEANLGELVKAISRSQRNLFPVVDKENNLLGMVKLADIRSIIFDHELHDKIAVKDLMYMPEHFISPDDNMEEVVAKFESSGRYNLAVIDEGKYLGFISRAKVFSKYRKTIRDFSDD
ncbi:MAG: chloride channel protein [Prolixibacteraceae bacterium]|nr:chloride channel protein [Prolixibacteraceae bacterium]